MELIPSGIQEINSTLVTCFCVMNPYCESQATITTLRLFDDLYQNSTYNVPGWIRSCLPIDSLLLSTLQYLYDESIFFPLLLYSLEMYYYHSPIDGPTQFNPQLFVYNPTVSRFPPNTSISVIMNEAMVEQWNPSLSYQRFYEACAPLYCSYSQTTREESLIGITIQLISMIGGIVVSWRILTPHIVIFILKLIQKPNRNPNETEQSNHLFDQIEQSFSTALYLKNVSENISF